MGSDRWGLGPAIPPDAELAPFLPGPDDLAFLAEIELALPPIRGGAPDRDEESEAWLDHLDRDSPPDFPDVHGPVHDEDVGAAGWPVG